MLTDPIIILYSYESFLARIDIWENGIMHTHIKADYQVSVIETKQIFYAAKKLGQGRSYKNLVTMDEYLLPSKESREFMITAERNEFVIADAYVIKSLAQKIAGNFYLKVNQPPRPTKMFNNKDVAISWLESI